MTCGQWAGESLHFAKASEMMGGHPEGEMGGWWRCRLCNNCWQMLGCMSLFGSAAAVSFYAAEQENGRGLRDFSEPESGLDIASAGEEKKRESSKIPRKTMFLGRRKGEA
mmetsp:Transcript_14050/g.21223  ORF Transcript_14050/g.21223 Transcript_14050/m.21223 type:complete len:110 (-) Transcript_14050:128-457(-)